MKAIVGVWKDDPRQVPQLYEFRTWAEALEFVKQERDTFKLWYHLTNI